MTNYLEPTDTLPESFIKDGLKIAARNTILGKKFSDMTRDELIAVAAHGWEAVANTRKEIARSANFICDLLKGYK